MWKISQKESLLELELLEVIVGLNKRPISGSLYIKYTHNFSLQSLYNHITRTLCLYQKFIWRFTHTLINFPNCFLIFWFCIKGNQVFYTWIAYIPVLLVKIQLLFSHCVKYAKIQAFSDQYFPVFGRNRIRIWTEYPILFKYGKIRIQFCPYTGKHVSQKARISAYFT